MRFGIVVFPGSNCEQDCLHVVRHVLRQPADYLWHEMTSLRGYDCVILPGGFSYGDYLRTGAVARFAPLMRAIVEFAHRGGLVLGICNGFQILLEAGLLPGAMLRNTALRFICRFVHLRVENAELPFTHLYRRGEVLRMPIAHNEGNYYVDDATLDALERQEQIVFRYCTAEGEITDEANPNGSVANIASVCNEQGNVLGLMPHPERCSEAALGSEDGRRLFTSLLHAATQRLELAR